MTLPVAGLSERCLSFFSSTSSARQSVLRVSPAAPIPALFKNDLRDDVSTARLFPKKAMKLIQCSGQGYSWRHTFPAFYAFAEPMRRHFAYCRGSADGLPARNRVFSPITCAGSRWRLAALPALLTSGRGLNATIRYGRAAAILLGFPSFRAQRRMTAIAGTTDFAVLLAATLRFLTAPSSSDTV